MGQIETKLFHDSLGANAGAGFLVLLVRINHQQKDGSDSSSELNKIYMGILHDHQFVSGQVKKWHFARSSPLLILPSTGSALHERSPARQCMNKKPKSLNFINRVMLITSNQYPYFFCTYYIIIR